MIINSDGVYRVMTPDEVAEYERMLSEMPNTALTPEERIAQLEEALNMLLEGVTEDG